MAARLRIVENMGSGRGSGAVVLARPDVPPAPLAARGAKILIVDDEDDVIQALKVRLETAGYHATTAGDGAQALALLQETKPDLILADLMMPNLDGLELTRRVRQNPNWRRVEVLLFSCNDDPVARELALELGARDYLSKTVGAPAIVSRINEILSAPMSAEGATKRNDSAYDHAERDLIAQLRAVSDNAGAAPPNGPQVVDAKPQALEQSGRTADNLHKLGKALGRSWVTGSRQTPDSGQ
jgi:DNA-binding response OmpR family regulator